MRANSATDPARRVLQLAILTPAEVAALAEAIEPRYRAMILFEKVPLPRFVADEMAAHLDTYGDAVPDALVFVGADGGALRANGWRARYWRPAIKKAALEPLRPHDLRHTAVSLWVAAGASPK